jgi:hypothetical protein
VQKQGVILCDYPLISPRDSTICGCSTYDKSLRFTYSYRYQLDIIAINPKIW